MTHFGRTSAGRTGSGDPWPDSGGGQGQGWLPILPSTSLYELRPAAEAGGSSCSRTSWNALRAVVGRGLGRRGRAGQQPGEFGAHGAPGQCLQRTGINNRLTRLWDPSSRRGARHRAEHLAVGQPSKELDTSHQEEPVFPVFAQGGPRDGGAGEHSDTAQPLGISLHCAAASKAELAPAAIGWRASGPFRNRDVCPWPRSRRCRWR